MACRVCCCSWRARLRWFSYWRWHEPGADAARPQPVREASPAKHARGRDAGGGDKPANTRSAAPSWFFGSRSTNWRSLSLAVISMYVFAPTRREACLLHAAPSSGKTLWTSPISMSHTEGCKFGSVGVPPACAQVAHRYRECGRSNRIPGSRSHDHDRRDICACDIWGRCGRSLYA